MRIGLRAAWPRRPGGPQTARLPECLVTTRLTGPGRRQPARIVDGQPEGGYTSMSEIICCDCSDHPGRDYREVPPGLQRIRGPYPIADGRFTSQGTRVHPDPVLVPIRKGRTGDG